MMQRSKALLFFNVRNLSTVPFVRQRKAHKEEMGVLRKTWQIEYQLGKDREEKQKIAEKERIKYEKAVRLREKRKVSVLKQEQARLSKENDLMRYKEKLARNQIIRGRQQEAEQTRYSHLVADLLAEKDSWITKENIDAKITDSLFEKQTTTGIVTKTSDLWRLQVISVDLDRVMSPELANEYTGQTLSDRLSRRGQFREAKKLYVQDILNPMIGSGEERANFKQLVEEFTATLDKAEAFEAFDFYNQTTFDHDSSEAIDHPHDLEEDHEMYFNPNTDDDEVDAAAVVSRGRGGAAGGKGKVVKGKAAPVTKGKGKR